MKHVNKKVIPLKKPLKGKITVPSDKSISHRAAMFGALTGGKVQIENFSKGQDCHSTLAVLKELGVEVEFTSEQNLVLNSENGFVAPEKVLDAGNSGTTIRLMSGILAGQNFECTITGDQSLQKRPMARVINPLKLMGANISAKDNDTKAPINIKGASLKGIKYESPIASAQVKSCLLLAGLFADGETVVTEPHRSRDHTEKMLAYLGADIKVDENKVTVKKSTLTPKPLLIPGDISSAAFFMVAAAIVPEADITLREVGLNPTRTGIIDALKNMGANIEIINELEQCGEPVGDVRVKYSQLKGTTIQGDIIPRLIDELPVIAVAATQAQGTTIIKDAGDLRNKESDRIKTTCDELKKLGANITETPDGFIIEGKTPLKGNATLECYHDHRLAMSAYVAGLIADAPIVINEFDWVNISFPEFCSLFEQIC